MKNRHLITLALVLGLAITVVGRVTVRTNKPEVRKLELTSARDSTPTDLDSGAKPTQPTPRMAVGMPSMAEPVDHITSHPTGKMDEIFRTSQNESRLKGWIEKRVISEEILDILLGTEQQPDVIRRNLGQLIALIEGTDADRLLKRYAIAALGLGRDEAALHLLTGWAFGNSESWKKRAAIYSLSSWLPEHREVADQLVRELSGSCSRETAYAALDVLLRRGVHIPETTLIKIVDDQPGITAQRSVELLAQLGNKDSLPYLRYVATNAREESIRSYALQQAEETEKPVARLTPGLAGERISLTLTTNGSSAQLEFLSIDWPPIRK